MITRYQKDIYDMRTGALTGKTMSFKEIGKILGRNPRTIRSTFWAVKKKIQEGQGDTIGPSRQLDRYVEGSDVLYDVSKPEEEAAKGLRCKMCLLLFVPNGDCFPPCAEYPGGYCAARINPFDNNIPRLIMLFKAVDNPDWIYKVSDSEVGNAEESD